MESSSFSDPAIIATLNSKFVPIMLNVTDDGFPAALPGLDPWHRAWDRNPFYKRAFATSVVIDSSGTIPLGTSGAGYTDEIDTATNYNPSKYSAWLNTALSRFQRYTAATSNPDAGARQAAIAAISAEVRQELAEAGRRQRNRM